MATFQLSGIPQFGGVIASSNSNAPQSSDANYAVNAISQANQADRSGANNVGVQALQGGASVLQGIKQINDQQALNTYQQKVGDALANNDTAALQKLYASNPTQAATTQQAIGLANDSLKQDAGNAAMDLKVAATQGPQAVASAIQKHQQTLQGMGIDPNQAVQAYQTNPQQFSQTADLVGMHAIGPEKYFDLQSKNAQINQQGAIANANYQLNQQKFQHQIQQDNTQNGFTAQKVDIQRGDQAIKQQMANQSGQQQSSNIQNQQFQQVQKKQDFVNGYDQQVNSTSGMLTTLNQVKQIDPSTFNGIWGKQGYITRNIPGSDSADAYSQIQQMQAQARQMGVIGMRGTGPVSDSEGQAAASAFLNLQPNVSSDRARTIINNWQQVLQRQVNYLNSQKSLVEKYRSDIQSYSGPQQASAPQLGQLVDGYMYTGGDPSSPNSWRKN
ncbi:MULTISPECIES: phage DNA ejection protein [unclassified Tatumella]|uniref:phage DNA ejection protein n=1 Tax=unclassified Tatumella TaxID=2649542 RepID=UPI001BAE82BB|nr:MULTISPECIES: phage DNA ejection protein [unclassified Tatumella]MBS0857232.1 phage DNA ejection protein [Tatumella sp. JGM16]MBS0913985.1 phage DNA ejection protein [Tatumella sp. JGM91]